MTDGGAFRQRIAARDVLLGIFLQLGSPVATEIAAQAGFDWLLVDLEHGAGSAPERAKVRAALAEEGDRADAFRDLFWALVNAKEFAFNH